MNIKENKKTSVKHIPLLQLINFTLHTNFVGFVIEEMSNKDNRETEVFLKR